MSPEGMQQAVRAIAEVDGPSAAFEWAADRFYEETGMLAIGKDDASASHSREERSARWLAWRKENGV